MVVGNKTLKLYEFETIGDYYEYIVESEINGNQSQMKELFNKLAKGQKASFLAWLRINEIKNIKLEDLI